MKTTVHLEARKREANAQFVERMKYAREQSNLEPGTLKAYLDGLREGYGLGLVDGVQLGLDVKKERDTSFETREIGLA